MANKDSSTRIVVGDIGEADKMQKRLDARVQERVALYDRMDDTGQHKVLYAELARDREVLAQKHARTKWVLGVLGVVVAAVALKGVWWVLDAGADKAKAAITADVAADLGAVKIDVGAVKLEVTAIKTTVADTAPMIEALFDMKTEPSPDLKSIRAKVAKKRAAIKAALPKDPQP